MGPHQESKDDQTRRTTPRTHGNRGCPPMDDKTKAAQGQWYPWKSREEMRAFSRAQKEVLSHIEDVCRDAAIHCEAQATPQPLPSRGCSNRVGRSRRTCEPSASRCHDTDSTANAAGSACSEPSVESNQGQRSCRLLSRLARMVRGLARMLGSLFLHNV